MIRWNWSVPNVWRSITDGQKGRRVRDLLNGLDQKFENRRTALYGTGKLPNLERAISASISEETRLQLEATGIATQGVAHRRSALFAADRNAYQRSGINASEITCYECGHPGHMRISCPELNGGGRARGQNWCGRDRVRMMGGRRGGQGRGTWLVGRANASAATKKASKTMTVEMTAEDLERWIQLKGMNLSDKHPAEASSPSSSAASANFGGTWDWKKTWDGENA